MAKKSSNGTGTQQAVGAAKETKEIEVVTSVDPGKPGNRIAIVTEILVFVDGRLTKVKRGRVRTVDIAATAEKEKAAKAAR